MLAMARHDPAAALRLQQMITAMKLPSKEFYDCTPLIDALGKQDPAAALAMANAQPEAQRHAALLEAAAYQPQAAAQTIIRDIVDKNGKLSFEGIARIAASDPEFAQRSLCTNTETGPSGWLDSAG